MPPDEQPGQGQGDGGSGSPYDSYLQTVPEQAREAAESWFRDTSKGLDAKLQEASELQKTLGPYQQVEGLNAYDPEQLSELLAWHQQVTSSDEAFQQWLATTAQEAGLTQAETETLEDAEVQGDLSKAQVEQMVNQIAEERLAPLQADFTQLQNERMIDSQETIIRDATSRLESERGLKLSPEERAIVYDLGMPYAVDGRGQDLPPEDISWIEKGLDRFQEIGTLAQKAFVSDKTNQPASAITGGSGQERQKPVTTFEEARAQATERFRASNQ
jgi:hypothetical protein